MRANQGLDWTLIALIPAAGWVQRQAKGTSSVEAQATRPPHATIDAVVPGVVAGGRGSQCGLARTGHSLCLMQITQTTP